MGFFKSIVKAVAAPVQSAVSVVSNVAQGDIKGAAKSAVSGVTSLSPVSQIENLSGGKFSELTSNVPILGSMGSKFISSSGTIGGSNGNFSGSDLRTYLREGAKLGAIAAGGYALAPTLGVTGTLTAAGIGSQIGNGNIRGGLQSALGAYTPEGYEGIGNLGQALIAKKPSSPVMAPPSMGQSNFLSGDSIEGPSVLLIAGLAIGAIFIIKKARGK